MRAVQLWWYMQIVCSIWHVWESGLSWAGFVSTCQCEKSICGGVVVSFGLSEKHALILAGSPEPSPCLFLIPSPSIVLYIYYAVSRFSPYLSGHLYALLTFCFSTWSDYLYALSIFCLDSSVKLTAKSCSTVVLSCILASSATYNVDAHLSIYMY